MDSPSGTTDEQSQPILILVDGAGLKTLKARPRFSAYLRELWQTRHFIARDARAKALAQGRGMFLGIAWLFLNPAIQVSLYAFIFGFIMKASRGVDNFIGFLIIGVVYFGFMSSGLNAGSSLIQRNRGLLNSFSFPKAAIAISTGLRSALDNTAAASLAVVAALISQYWIMPNWTIILVVPVFLLLHIFITGIILIVSRITAFVPDFKSLLTVITRVLFFTSGVFWPIEHFIHDPTLAGIMGLNPFHQFLDCIRVLVLDGEVPSLFTTLSVIVWPLATLLIGLVYFWRAEHRYATIK